MEEVAVREVWAKNVMEELQLILVVAESFPFIAVDTEFSSFLRVTSRFASMEQLYQDVKHNVEGMELVQVGFTFFDLQSFQRRIWQINIACRTNVLPPSVKLQRKSGIDLERNMDDSIDAELLSDLLLGSASFDRRSGRTWVTFHGIYDLAYLVKLLSHSPLPDTITDFALLASDVLGVVGDTKYIARFCGEVLHGGELSLVRLFHLLGVRPSVVLHHQAGHDSLLIAMAYQKMCHTFPHILEVELEGFMWGIESCWIRRPEEQPDVDGDSSQMMSEFVTIVPMYPAMLPRHHFRWRW